MLALHIVSKFQPQTGSTLRTLRHIQQELLRGSHQPATAITQTCSDVQKGDKGHKLLVLLSYSLLEVPDDQAECLRERARVFRDA